VISHPDLNFREAPLKHLFTLTCALVLTSALAQAGEDFNCVQRKDRTPIDPATGSISVTIKTVADITATSPIRNNYDYVFRAKVVVSNTISGKTTILKSFTAVATSYDVQFNVWANKAHGVGIYIYMDELDEAGIQLTEKNGKKTSIALDCSGSN
jgi:hypothetical protein